jgi:hypothetical protein
MNDTTQEELPPLNRFNAICYYKDEGHPEAEMVSVPNGKWVSYEHAAQCIATLKAENERLQSDARLWKAAAFRLAESVLDKGSYSWTPQELVDAYNKENTGYADRVAAQSQAAALQAELTEAKAQWAKWAGLYEHELDNCNKAESQAAAMAVLLEEAREWMGEPPIYFQPSAPGSWRARIDAALAAWKGKAPVDSAHPPSYVPFRQR